MKCKCDYCYFQSVGIAKEAVEFVDQTTAKKRAFDFLCSAFREAHPQRRSDGLSENTIAIMLAEWGLGKTQLLKYMRTAINNSSGISAKLRGEYDIPFSEDSLLGQVTLESLAADIMREDTEAIPQIHDQLALLTERRGAAFRIDAISFHDEIAGEPNLLVPLFNIVLRRCQIDHRVTGEDLRSVTRIVLDHLEVDRLFIFFDELEALRTVETGPLRFDQFFQNFAIRIKSIIDNSVPPDVSICLATIPSVWDALTRQFEELGALKSRASTGFIQLSPLTLEKAHEFILSRCRTADNSPFTDGAIRTLLEATGKNPRYLNQLCFGLQPQLQAAPIGQFSHILDYLGNTATDRTAFTYDHQALLEFKDAATQSWHDPETALQLLDVLAGELREYSAAQLRPILEEKNVPKIEEVLNRLSTIRLRGVHAVVKLIGLDRAKILMDGKSLREQQSLLLAQRYLDERDVRIERQRLLVHDLDYERDIVQPLESLFLDGSPAEYFLPTADDGGIEEMTSLWKLSEGPALDISRTLRALAAIPHTVPVYRLSLAMRERVFPRQSPKEKPFDWVDETFWREAFAHLHNPATPPSEKRHLLLNGLRLAGRAYGAHCTLVDETSLLWILDDPRSKNSQYADSKPLRSLVQLVNEIGDLGTAEFEHRLRSNDPDFLICISLAHLPSRPRMISKPEGRPEIEVMYHELNTGAEFKLQLLSKLNQEATDRGWYHSGKMKAAQESLADEVYGKVVETWLACSAESGYLVIGWEIPHGVREDSLARVVREVIATFPEQPATYEDIMGRLRRMGLREPLDEELIAVLERNGQLVRDAQDRLKIRVLPTQERIIHLSERFPPNRGEPREEYASRIAEHFWQGIRTELERELTRHILVVEELGFFDGHTDLDLVLQRIDQKLDKVTQKDRDGASIDQYAYEARRGQIGAKRAERLSREREYFREQFHYHSLDFQRIEHDHDLLLPRVVRHQLVDVEKRVQEIIATGEGPYDEGRKAVQRARTLLQSAHFELIGEGAEFRIKDHVEILRDYSSYALLGDIVSAHRDGVVADDEARNLRSPASLLQELVDELTQLTAERDGVRKEMDSYRESHQTLTSQAARLGKEPGLHSQVQAQVNRLKRSEPSKMFRLFKEELESVGLTAGREKISSAIRELAEIQKELDSISEVAQDLQRLSDIIEALKKKEHDLSALLEPSRTELWGESYELGFVPKQAGQLLKGVRTVLGKLEGLQSEYRATKMQREMLDDYEQLDAQTGEQIEELDTSREEAISAAEQTVGIEEGLFSAAIEKAKTKSTWASEACSVVTLAFKSTVNDALILVFKSPTSQEFHNRLLDPTQDTLRQGLEVAQGIADLASWLSVEYVRLDDFAGTEFEKRAKGILDEQARIEKQCARVTRLKRWKTVYSAFQSLLKEGSDGGESHGKVPDLNRRIRELKSLSLEAATERISAAESFIQALFAASLLNMQQRRNLLNGLDELRKPDLSYRLMVESVKQLYQLVSENAKSQLEAKELPGGHNPDVVLAIVQEVYQQSELPLRQAIRLDQETEGKTILWLVRQGVLEGQLHMAGDRA